MKKISPRWNYVVMVFTGTMIIALFQHHLAGRASIVSTEAKRLNLGNPNFTFPFSRRAVEEWEAKVEVQLGLETELKSLRLRALDKGLSVDEWVPPFTSEKLSEWRATVAEAPISKELLSRLDKKISRYGISMAEIAVPIDGYSAGQWSAALDNLEDLPIPSDSSLRVMRTEVTQGLYMVVMGENPSSYPNCGFACPVDFVSFDQARLFATRLNKAQGKVECGSETKEVACSLWRLPTLEEWRLMASADGLEAPLKINDVGWFIDNSDATIHPVASQPPNDIGIFDVFGNVAEWIETRQKGSHIGGSILTLRAAQRELISKSKGKPSKGVGFRLIRREISK